MLLGVGTDIACRESGASGLLSTNLQYYIQYTVIKLMGKVQKKSHFKVAFLPIKILHKYISGHAYCSIYLHRSSEFVNESLEVGECVLEERLGYAKARVQSQLTDVLVQKIDCIHKHLLLTPAQKQRKTEGGK